MSEIHDLSPDARRRLLQCYELLLRLAEEADEQNITADIEAQEDTYLDELSSTSEVKSE